MVHLNLARKWRSKTFDELVGQELSVRILKNTLFLGHYFPVYLFSGQRGCGKTTMARIFASAVNCEKLTAFQQDPKTISMPCLTCISCRAMSAGNHPDFIEIDAASHTGVDNVRNIIDAASLLPVLGRKRIYLIDEAHMLSKAAFNAFLKILEEPPMSVLFILATTDVQKIIDTVKSRSFQLFFRAVPSAALINHLAMICDQEKIPYEQEGIALIVQETEGSVRDALNLLEQVRFAYSSVTYEAALQVLGNCNDELLLNLCAAIIAGDAAAVLQLLNEADAHQWRAESIWYGLLDVVRALMAHAYGIEQTRFILHADRIAQLAASCSRIQRAFYLQELYAHELQFQRTKSPRLFLELVLLKLCDPQAAAPVASAPAPKQRAPIPVAPAAAQPEKIVAVAPQPPVEQRVVNPKWQEFLRAIEIIEDQFVLSLFKQSVCELFDEETGRVDVSFPQQFSFFQDTLDKASNAWKPLLEKSMGKAVTFNAQFTLQTQQAVKPRPQEPVKMVVPKPAPVQQPANDYSKWRKEPYVKKVAPIGANEPVVDVSDAAAWQKAQALLDVFPGMITEVNEGTNE